MNKEQSTIVVPQAMHVQLARLFGSDSKEAKAGTRTLHEWRQTLDHVLDELQLYLQGNVHTDRVHFFMLQTGLDAARESLKAEDFFLGYIEGITRFALLLMGDYPDHRRRKQGRKKNDHYELSYQRSQIWFQNADQRLRTPLAAWRFGAPRLSRDPMETLREFRELFGDGPNYQTFLEWYKLSYPEDYAAIF